MKHFNTLTSQLDEMVQTHAQDFVDWLNDNKTEGGYYYWGVRKGAKYSKVFHGVAALRDNPVPQESAFAFVDNKTGTMYKAAGWKAKSNTVLGTLPDYHAITRRSQLLANLKP